MSLLLTEKRIQKTVDRIQNKKQENQNTVVSRQNTESNQKQEIQIKGKTIHHENMKERKHENESILSQLENRVKQEVQNSSSG